MEDIASLARVWIDTDDQNVNTWTVSAFGDDRGTREPEGSEDQTPDSGSGQTWPSRSITDCHEEDATVAGLQMIKDRAAQAAAVWVS
eukprot:6636306-Pyramimonas_sp.AAC.1